MLAGQEEAANDLKAWRQSKGVSQRRLAHLVGARHSYINRLEKGREIPTLWMLEKIVKTLEQLPTCQE
jgi:predicted transcriptional regulator